MLKISVKRHVFSVLYSIRQHDTPKSRDSRAVFLKSREKQGSGSKSWKSRKSRDTGQPANKNTCVPNFQICKTNLHELSSGNHEIQQPDRQTDRPTFLADSYIFIYGGIFILSFFILICKQSHLYSIKPSKGSTLECEFP